MLPSTAAAIIFGILNLCVAGEAEKESHMPALTETQRARLNRALEPLHAKYDPAEKMLRRPFSSPGYHTTLKGGFVHSTREALNYAAALLDTGDEQLRTRAEEVIARVVALQDKDPKSKTYGIWSWFLEEPLEKMSPPDWNWADFCGVQLLQVALDHRARLPAPLMADVDEAIKHAARSIQRRNVGPGYTNIAIMGTYVTLVAAETYGISDLKTYAMERLRKFHQYTFHHGAFTEYNSPTYTVVALSELARMLQHAKDAEARRLAEEIYRLAWEEIAQHFHAPTLQWSGPHSRCYSTLLPAGTLGLIERATEGRAQLGSKAGVKEFSPSIDELRPPLSCPRDLESFFTTLDAPRTLAKTFLKGDETPLPPPLGGGGTMRPIVGTTHLAPRFVLGSINRGDLWNQRRALLAYWGSADKPSYLHLRFLHDGYDFSAAQFFSVQRDGSVLAGINVAVDGGDTHISLDRIKNATIKAKDLRLRFEFGGAAAAQDFTLPAELAASARIQLDGVRLTLAVPYARLGDAVGRWETSKEKGKAGLDVVLYAGPEREFHLADIEQAVVGLAMQFAADETAFPNVSAAVRAGRLEMEWSGLRLSLPVKPDKASVLQNSFSGGTR